jgi:Bacterial PH domain
VAKAAGDPEPGRDATPDSRRDALPNPPRDAGRDGAGRETGVQAGDTGGGSARARKARRAAGRAAAARDVMRARPVRARRVAFAVAAVVVVLFVVLAALLGRTSSEGVEFGPGDQVAMALLGGLVAAGVLLLARPSVVADLDGVRVRNIFTTKDVPWEVVRAVSFRDGTPWAMLDLADDDQIAVLAVQAADGERAVAAVRALRALHARHAAGEGRGPSTRSHGVT